VGCLDAIFDDDPSPSLSHIFFFFFFSFQKTTYIKLERVMANHTRVERQTDDIHSAYLKIKKIMKRFFTDN